MFGTPFFKGYYTIHDAKEGKMKIVPYSTSSKQPLVKGQLPLKSIDALDGRGIMWVTLILCGIATVVIVCYALLFEPQLEKWFPQNIMAVIGVSLAYFVLFIIIFIFGIYPPLKKAFE